MSFAESWHHFWHPDEEKRYQPLMALPSHLPYIDPALPFVNFGGLQYPMQTLNADRQEVPGTFARLVQAAYKSNGIVWACEQARIGLFGQARFQWRAMDSGRPGKYFGTPELAILEQPWPKATTGDLLRRMLLYADFGDNCFVVRRPDGTLRPLRPDWVSVILGSERNDETAAWDVDADMIGILYQAGGSAGGQAPVFFQPPEFAHFTPSPDPLLPAGLGTGWLKTVVSEVLADKAATAHKLQFFENAATPNLLITVDKNYTDPQLEKLREIVNTRHEGISNAYRTMILRAAVETATAIGANFQQMEFKATQGAGETRIAAAAQVPAVVVGISEGLQGSALNAGNFAASMRRFADLFARPAWQNVAGSLQAIVKRPNPAAVLWYDDRDVPALKEDIKDRADVQSTEANSIRTLLEAGFEAEAALDAVIGGNWAKLKNSHTGLFSVQLQAPGSTKMPQGEAPGEMPVEGTGGPEVPAINPAKPTTPTPTGGAA